MSPAVAPRVVHVVVGPVLHGVPRHATWVAQQLGHRLLTLPSPRADDDVLRAVLREVLAHDVVHVPFTDRLFAPRAEEAAAAFEAVVEPWLEAGVALSVTLHDLPEVGASALDDRRAAAYRRVVAGARGVVVNSWRELGLVEPLLPPGGVARLRGIPLPLIPPDPAGDDDACAPGALPDAATLAASVVVLGHVFPDRGYEHTLSELPPGVGLVAAGAPSEGHDDLPGQLAEVARRAGRTMLTTGYVPDALLGSVLTGAGVPVAPNRRVGASASVLSWVAHGRRPLVPDSPYGRELVERMPGAVRLYDADEPGALRGAVAAALADPGLTRVEDPAGAPLPGAVVQAYDEHLRACAPPSRLPLGDGRWVVPGNRWDLLDGLTPQRDPAVTVVVPHHDDQAGLDLVLTALRGQDHPAARLQVVVADDGSPQPPRLDAAGDLDVRLVRQERRGFRAAAARNLGAAAADGEVLVFLDGDTVPEPGYVRAAARLPALLPDALVVGRRRHADLTGWTPQRLTAWLSGQGPAPRLLAEPEWLRVGYRDSADLLHVDTRSYRFVISAVMTTSRDLWRAVGGFDERFTAYGGEDWELAHRACCAGAVLAHEPSAVAWHDGPDWGARVAPDEARVVKNAEVLSLASRLPDPLARGGGSWARPWLVVVLRFADPVEVLATARALLAGGADCGIWVEHPQGGRAAEACGDPRVHAGPPPEEATRSAVAVMELDRPTLLHGSAVEALVARAVTLGTVGLPTGRVSASWLLHRAARWAPRVASEATILGSRLGGREDRGLPRPLLDPDLASVLRRVGSRAGSGDRA